MDIGCDGAVRLGMLCWPLHHKHKGVWEDGWHCNVKLLGSVYRATFLYHNSLGWPAYAVGLAFASACSLAAQAAWT